ncbi:Myosin-binding protein 3, partial [Mucuna pruriens]
MATNKFATMLHRNTNKTTLVLVYVMLEWILIILLLLNSLFSYLIIKFVDYFGLKRPCIWCTRIDHIIEPGNNKCSCRDLVCEAHAFEISKLGFCLNHRKLAESETMCEDCSSSHHSNFVNFSQSFDLFPWMQQKGMIHGADDNNKVLENGVENLRCSCCGVNFVSKFYLIRDKPSLRVLDYTQKQNLITESGVGVEIGEGHHKHSDHGRGDFVLHHVEEEKNIVGNRGNDLVFNVDEGSGGGKEAVDISVCSVCDGGTGKETVCGENFKLDLGIRKGQEEAIREETLNAPKDDQPCEKTTRQVACTSENTEQIPPKHLEFVIPGNDFLLVPVEFGDSFTAESENQYRYKVGNDGLGGDEDVILDFDINSGAECEPVVENWHTSGDTVSVSSGLECTKAFKANGVESIPMRIRGQSLELIVKEENLEHNYQEVKFAQTTEDSSINGYVEANIIGRDGELCSDVPQVSEGTTQMWVDELEAEVSTQNQDILVDSNQQLQEVPSSSTTAFTVQDDSGKFHLLSSFFHKYITNTCDIYKLYYFPSIFFYFKIYN